MRSPSAAASLAEDLPALMERRQLAEMRAGRRAATPEALTAYGVTAAEAMPSLFQQMLDAIVGKFSGRKVRSAAIGAPLFA